MKTGYIVALLVALTLIIGVDYIYRHPYVLNSSYEFLSEKCEADNRFCLAALAPIKILADTAYEIRRDNIPRTDLPVMRIYLSDGALQKLQAKRASVLAEKMPILLSTDDDWVRGKLIVDDGTEKKNVKASIRLKGDWADHIRMTNKLSFRIKIRNKDRVFGMSKFSIQNPDTRKDHNGALLLAMMQKIGVLAPRYFFVDVRINDQSIGIMALEEHFTKEMIESQRRREGPIIAFDEEWLWQQRHLNYNRCNLKEGCSGLNFKYRDLPIKTFRSGKFEPGTIRSQHMMRAVSILRDHMDGMRPGRITFDMDLVSRWWIMTNIWNGKHGAVSHNRRFYFNPVTSRLEPISFDNDADPMGSYSDFINDLAIYSLLKEAEFRKATRRNLEVIRKMLLSDDFRAWYDSKQQDYLEILSLESKNLNRVPIEYLALNLEVFSQYIKNYFSNRTTSGNSSVLTQPATKRRSDPITGMHLLNTDAPLFTHLRSFWFWSPTDAEIELKNMTIHPVHVDSVYFNEHPDNNLLEKKIVVPVYTKGKNDHILAIPVTAASNNFSDTMLVRYTYRGDTYIKPVLLQFRNTKSSFLPKGAAMNWIEENGVIVNEKGKSLIFPKGKYYLDNSIEVERDWQIVLLPGVEISFVRGAVLKANGPVYSLGSKDSQVRFIVQSDPVRGLLGSWGGLFVLNANRRSILRHTEVLGMASTGPEFRQDSIGLTGCITFYDSDVTVENSAFRGLQCEDSLNIVAANFNLVNTTIENAHADAFDSDFSSGVISDSQFKNIGNDGIDISGSEVTVNAVYFNKISDKAISVGEESRMTVRNVDINNASSGVVSKDKSVAHIENTNFRNINGSALFAYVKKQEFGPSSIHCKQCIFTDVESTATEQFGCQITIDGKDIDTTPFTRKQLRAAGYIQ